MQPLKVIQLPLTQFSPLLKFIMIVIGVFICPSEIKSVLIGRRMAKISQFKFAFDIKICKLAEATFRCLAGVLYSWGDGETWVVPWHVIESNVAGLFVRSICVLIMLIAYCKDDGECIG